jgi:hypothetical protein
VDAPDRPPTSAETSDERIGCLDIAAATAGMGCAMAVRTVIIVGAFVILILAFKLAGFGSGTVHHHIPLTATPVVRYGVDGRALVFAYFLHFQKKLRWRVVDQFHAGVDVFQ